jgi:EpsI family protein
MFSRRDLLVALGCTATLAAAEALKPRRSLILLDQNKKLSDIIPTHFPGWQEGGFGDIVIPQGEGSLSARLYQDQLARIYHPVNHEGPSIMLLLAYGKSQDDLLQIHRPEACYPAVGFTIISRFLVDIATASAGPVKAVGLTAQTADRTEDIMYWARIGHGLPQTSGQQTWTTFKEGLAGNIPDGILVRASAIREGANAGFADIEAFFKAMISALTPAARLGLIGK